MPRRDDISSILVLGSGPIVIGQACEFDYSGTQACRVLREEGYRVILANSNPATIMTDPGVADRTYVEPLEPDVLTAIVERERPDAILPTMGGQTALNLATALSAPAPDGGPSVLERFGVELIGASRQAIETAEDREKFKQAMTEIGLDVPESGFAHDLEEAMAVGQRVGYPLIVRPSFILGGAGTGIAADADELRLIASAALGASPISEVLIETSVAGWKEFELEVMRDRRDNCVVVCSIENLDPMGVHTGDSVTVAPSQTLSDVEYQVMRDAAFACIRRVGVETGGSNIQFAVNPATGQMLVIEMNPRVSRSSALASKATGFPIAKIAARLAVGYTLDEIVNDITGATPACFEPTIDYVVTKVPRWAFEKLPGAPDRLGTRMQSVGEVMAIGRTFPESLQKALRGLELGRLGLNCDPVETVHDELTPDELVRAAARPTPQRLFQLEAALRAGVTVERLARETGVDPWFLDQIAEIVAGRHDLEAVLDKAGDTGPDSGSAGAPVGDRDTSRGAAALQGLRVEDWRRAKRLGFGDGQIAWLAGASEPTVRAARLAAGVGTTFKGVDTCGAEFAATTPYYYSSFEDEDEVRPAERPRVIILGSGPNRIGQGIEFDYCCVHASLALREAGYETVMVNCNPETVSTDYDTSDRLYFEPITEEDVLAVIEAEQRAGGDLAGVIVGLGGQTPLKLAGRLDPALVLGTSAAAIDLAEDRELWAALCARLEIPQPAGGTARTVEEALAVSRRIGYPALVRPSYVLGGRAMRIVYDDEDLADALNDLAARHLGSRTGGPVTLGVEVGLSAERPVLIDRFLEDAIEVDVDAIRDGAGEVFVAGVMEHVEEAGVHSGDSACVIPPPTLSAETVDVICGYTRAIAAELGVVGPLNVQYAVKTGQVFVIEANPRASRTVPFVAKAIGVPVAKIAARVMVGATLAGLRAEGLLSVAGTGPVFPSHVAVKEAVLPFDRFPGVDTLLGPEMRSTGEVMGIDASFGLAFAKAQMAAGNRLPAEGVVFFSLADRDKAAGVGAARAFVDCGADGGTPAFRLAATSGTARLLRENNIDVAPLVIKLGEHAGAHGPGAVDAVELIRSGTVKLVVNTPRGSPSRGDGRYIREAAAANGVACVTTVAAARAAAAGVAAWREGGLSVRSLQEHQESLQQDQQRTGRAIS
jgi:carbamoyl-phosphate synthase large subunit